MKKFKVYAKINSDSYITTIDSSAFLTDLIDWLEIDEGSGDKFHHAQGNYFDKPLKTENGVYQYKLEDGVVRECTAEELAEQEAEENKPTTPTAPRNITAGEYITVNGVLYKATANIPNGGAIITGHNAEETTVEVQLYELTQKGE